MPRERPRRTIFSAAFLSEDYAGPIRIPLGEDGYFLGDVTLWTGRSFSYLLVRQRVTRT